MFIRMSGYMQLPVVYGGGYMYSREVTATMDGVPVPQELRLSKGFWDDPAWDQARDMLDAATFGAIYAITEWPDEDQDFSPEVQSWRKIGPDEWLLIE